MNSRLIIFFVVVSNFVSQADLLIHQRILQDNKLESFPDCLVYKKKKDCSSDLNFLGLLASHEEYYSLD